MVCQAEGNPEGARDLFQLTLDSEKIFLGGSHPSLALTRVRLAGVLQELDHSEHAREEASEALRSVSGQPEGSSFRVQVEPIAAKILQVNTD